MSTSDQLLLARIAGVCSRHCARGEIDDLHAAVAELRAVAGDKPELLAQHAGLSLGRADGDPSLASRYRAEAALARAAGQTRRRSSGGSKLGASELIRRA